MTTKNESTQKAQLRSYQLTRREFLPLLGAATVAATAARPVAAAAAGKPKKKPNDAEARFVYVGTYTAPGVPPAELTRAQPSASTCSGWTRTTAG